MSNVLLWIGLIAGAGLLLYVAVELGLLVRDVTHNRSVSDLHRNIKNKCSVCTEGKAIVFCDNSIDLCLTHSKQYWRIRDLEREL